jgi:serine protease Do
VTEQGERKERPSSAAHDEELGEENGREFTEEELIELFKAAEEEGEAPPSFFRSSRFHKIIAGVLAVMLCAQVLAFLPQVFSLAAVRFLTVSAQLSQSPTIQQYKEAVVVIRTDDSKGTGFIVSEDGLVVTNRHVVGNSKSPRVHLANGQTHYAKVLSVDSQVDLAVLDIDASSLPTLPLAERYDGAVETKVYVIGNPLFFNGIANEGVTWGLRPGEEPQMMALQAPIYRGNSGSPVIDPAGEVIGVVFATSSMERDGQEHGIGLAVPVEYVRKHLPE